MKPTLLWATAAASVVGLSGLVMWAAVNAPTTAPATTSSAAAIAPYEAQSKDHLNKSPRHGEFVDIKVPYSTTPMKTFVVYPERPDKAPMVVVIMEIFGLSDWLRATSDQLAAEGFIAVAPDFVSGKGPNGGGTEAFANQSDVTRIVSGLKKEDVMAGAEAARQYGIKLPAANGKSASIGFCWGGGMSFSFATTQPELSAAVVFYGTPPAEADMAKIKCPVAGFYGGNDARITATVVTTTASMKKLEKVYDPHVFDGAGHGFMRAHAPTDSAANQKAADAAWPLAIQFLKDATK